MEIIEQSREVWWPPSWNFDNRLLIFFNYRGEEYDAFIPFDQDTAADAYYHAARIVKKVEDDDGR